MPSEFRIAAICVAYHPDLERFKEVLAATSAQVATMIVMDNGQPESADVRSACEAYGAFYRHLEFNSGLAAAFNAGIRRAAEFSATHVLLLDQDSVPAPDMVTALIDGWRRMSAACHVGAAGPAYHDEITDRDAIVLRFGTWRRYRETTSGLAAGACAPTDMLISSGSLISMANLDQIGAMDETLFIDHVDTDWAFRAKHAGLKNFVVVSAGMSHRLGERCARPWLFGRRSVVLHRPFRLYYIVRNSLLLYRRPHASARWILFDCKRLALLSVAHIVYGPNRVNVLRCIVRGLVHGLRGRAGPLYPDSQRQPTRDARPHATP